LAAGEPRVRVLRDADGPSGLLNHGLAATPGDWLMRIDAHDLLPSDALYRLVDLVQSHPDAELVYGDEDDVDGAGRRTGPRFKPDWNPDLLESHDYLGRGVAYRSSVLQALGGFEDRLQGAEDYDLALRFLRRRPAGTVRHVHRIVYHRRRPAANETPADRADAAGRLALELHFAGTGTAVERGAGPSLYRVRRPVPAPAPLVSLIVPTRDQVGLLRSCVDSLLHKTAYPCWELLIVDNGSTEAETLSYLESLQREARIRVLRYAAPFNFPALNNFAVAHARGEVLVLLNNDVEAIAPDWLAEMVSHAVRPEVGAVGAKLLYPDHTVQHAGVVLGIGGVAGHVHRFLPADDPGYCHRAAVTQGMSAVTGACLAVRKALYQQVGGMDDRHLLVAFNDIDFCLKLLEAGYRNVFTPWALLYHHESVSRGMDDTPQKKEVFRREFEHMRRRWAARLQAEPAYNRNLSVELENFSIRT
jgi:GT2 family glycosyltransferase